MANYQQCELELKKTISKTTEGPCNALLKYKLCGDPYGRLAIYQNMLPRVKLCLKMIKSHSLDLQFKHFLEKFL